MPLLVALDECAAALCDIEALVQLGLANEPIARNVLLAILMRSNEGRQHILDLVDGYSV
jgi:hypothetical protein